MITPKVYVALQQFCETDEEPLRLLRDAGLEVRRNLLGRRLKKEEMASLLDGADAVLAGVEPYDAELLAKLPSLKAISRCGVGTDSIDLEAARRLNIRIMTTAEQVIEPVAQMTVAMILALARNLPAHIRDFDRGEWKKQTGFLISEWTVGLIGFGRIGKAVERCLRPFSPRVLVHDPALAAGQVPEHIELCPLADLLSRSDLISIHAAADPRSGPVLGAVEFARMKPGCRLVNTARGHLVDEEALLEALRCGKLAGAALDVFRVEPYTGPLTRLPNVLCTPHVGTLTRASRRAMELSCARQVAEFFKDKR